MAMKKCQMLINMVSKMSEYLVFSNASAVKYFSNVILAEYKVGLPKIYTMDVENFSNVVVDVPLARLLGYAFLNIYTTSLIILIMVYTTLYFRMDIFEVWIMTALTALLIIATLFLPKSQF
ncbi:uncharacterized protein LOC143039095 isoform X2 [Oratosquilla oratoria]|uniref:uncharacterized protein LOC143039095 isoform X2 n=1 Tax=Oratosquilla oratoria TaxID=337810 RepID=UPI003F77784C